jgi:hypothetical protein
LIHRARLSAEPTVDSNDSGTVAMTSDPHGRELPSQGGKTRHARMFLGVGQIGKLDHDRTVGGVKRIHHLRVRKPRLLQLQLVDDIVDPRRQVDAVLAFQDLRVRGRQAGRCRSLLRVGTLKSVRSMRLRGRSS